MFPHRDQIICPQGQEFLTLESLWGHFIPLTDPHTHACTHAHTQKSLVPCLCHLLYFMVKMCNHQSSTIETLPKSTNQKQSQRCKVFNHLHFVEFPSSLMGFEKYGQVSHPLTFNIQYQVSHIFLDINAT